MTRRTPSADDGAEALLGELRRLGSDTNRAGMARYGINTARAFGVPVATLRAMAKRHRNDHALAAALWRTGCHEARILAALVDDPQRVTSGQMDRWAAAIDSWDLCDQVCANLFVRTPFVEAKITVWAQDDRMFVRRAAFSLLAAWTVHGRDVSDARLAAFLPVVEDAATDPRTYVRKAVNWALRQIGKRSHALHRPALALADRLAASGDATARWIGRDAARELRDPARIARIRR